jgi:anoctamin-10
MKGFWTSKFYDNFDSMNYIKSYYGEKYAFEFAFLVHYQSWLLFPTIVGLCLFFFQCYHWYNHDLDRAADGSLNAVFGILLSLWSTAFIESWKHKEKVIKFYWAVEKKTIEKDDERTD